jgi:16S rRNA (cytosine1402-N4)-methyltransferase
VSLRHEPVLLDESLARLWTGPGLYLDATLGYAGHAHALLARHPEARLLGGDRDPVALGLARTRLAEFGDRVMLVHATFAELPAVHAASGGEPLAGALVDLGLSSMQIDDPGRGMSFMQEGPLDLRMDATRGEPASTRLAHVTEEELAEILRTLGDVRGARRLARAIVNEAARGMLPTTRALRETVDRALGGRSHPRRYAQVFQALRMWVNDEAGQLDALLEWLPDAVRAGGVVVTLAYHSGEDRRIKQALRGRVVSDVPRRLPVAETPRASSPWESLTARVVRPTAKEEAANPRARSARLRAFRRKSA